MTVSDTPPPLTDEELDAAFACVEQALNTPWEPAFVFGTTGSETLDRIRVEVDRLRAERGSLLAHNGVLVTEVRFQAEQAEAARAELAEARRVADCNNVAFQKSVDELTAVNSALRAKLAAVEKVIEPSDWKPLSERHPEYFTPDTPEEAARKKGWKQGVDLLTQQLRAALGETGGTE